MAPNQINLDRLKAQLLTSGLSQSNSALYQVINQLIDATRQLQSEINASINTINQTIINNTTNLPQALQGIDGLDGLDGEVGIPGQQGFRGIQGIQGQPGFDGFDGEDGLDGIPGVIGRDGAAGATGPSGISGSNGINGIDGEDGEDSLIPGPIGPSGSSGSAGATGAAGIQGYNGLDGADGDIGEQGIQGIQGLQGPAGSGGGSATTVEVDLGSTPTWRGKFTIIDALISSTSKVNTWQAPGPYTGKGTRADEAEMDPLWCVTEPGTGQAIVYWQSLPMLTPILYGLSGGNGGKSDAPGGTLIGGIGRLTSFDIVGIRRLGKIKGNVKFSYQVLS